MSIRYFVTNNTSTICFNIVHTVRLLSVLISSSVDAGTDEFGAVAGSGTIVSVSVSVSVSVFRIRIRIRIRMVDAGTEDATVPTERCATTVRKTVRSRDEFVLFDVDVAVAVSRNRARNRNRRAGIR